MMMLVVRTGTRDSFLPEAISTISVGGAMAVLGALMLVQWRLYPTDINFDSLPALACFPGLAALGFSIALLFEPGDRVAEVPGIALQATGLACVLVTAVLGHRIQRRLGRPAGHDAAGAPATVVLRRRLDPERRADVRADLLADLEQFSAMNQRDAAFVADGHRIVEQRYGS